MRLWNECWRESDVDMRCAFLQECFFLSQCRHFLLRTILYLFRDFPLPSPRFVWDMFFSAFVSMVFIRIMHPPTHARMNTKIRVCIATSQVGTSSLRRRALLARLHAHLTVADIRGNLQTRYVECLVLVLVFGLKFEVSNFASSFLFAALLATLSACRMFHWKNKLHYSTFHLNCAILPSFYRTHPSLPGNSDRYTKLEGGQYDAIVLAQAGVVRLGWADRIRCGGSV